MRKWFETIGAALVALMAAVSGASAQGDKAGGFTAGGPGGFNERGGAVQRVQVQMTPERLMPGGKAVLKVTVTVSKGYHINATQPGR